MKKLLLLFLLISYSEVSGQNTSLIANEIERITFIKDWENAKKKVLEFYKTIAQNPNELQIVAKYEVSKLEKTIDYYLAREKSLFEQTNSNKNINACNKYLEEFPYSSKRRAVNWKLATYLDTWESYHNFLNIYSVGDFVIDAKDQMDTLDEKAFEYAKNIGTSYALNSYIENIFRGKYLSKAKQLLSEKFEENDFISAKNSNTISAYRSFLSKYPKGKFVSKAQLLLEDSFFDIGDQAFKKQSWQASIDGFQEYLRQYPLNSRATLAKKRIESAKKRLLFQSNTMNYLSYDFDKENQIGFSFGMLNTQKTSLYMKFKINKEMLNRGGLFATVDNSGYSSSINDVVFTGDYQYNNWSYILGLNIKVYEPAWIYLGAGVLNRGLYLEADEYDSYGDYQKTRWMKNTDQQSYKFVGEGGLAFNVLNKGILKVGVSYYEKKIIPQFGIGLGWK
jgi:hypothetical protein